jgi:hypothetical protein
MTGNNFAMAFVYRPRTHELTADVRQFPNILHASDVLIGRGEQGYVTMVHEHVIAVLQSPRDQNGSIAFFAIEGEVQREVLSQLPSSVSKQEAEEMIIRVQPASNTGIHLNMEASFHQPSPGLPELLQDPQEPQQPQHNQPQVARPPPRESALRAGQIIRAKIDSGLVQTDSDDDDDNDSDFVPDPNEMGSESPDDSSDSDSEHTENEQVETESEIPETSESSEGSDSDEDTSGDFGQDAA